MLELTGDNLRCLRVLASFLAHLLLKVPRDHKESVIPIDFHAGVKQP